MASCEVLFGSLSDMESLPEQGSDWSVVRVATLNGRRVIVKEQTKEPGRLEREWAVINGGFPSVVEGIGIAKDGDRRLLVMEEALPLPRQVSQEKAQEFANDLMIVARRLYLAGHTWVARPKHVGIGTDGRIRIFDFNDDDVRRDVFLPEDEFLGLNVRRLIDDLCVGWGYDGKLVAQGAFDHLVEDEYRELVNVHQPICFSQYGHFMRRDLDTKKVAPANRKCKDRLGMMLPFLGKGAGRTHLDIGCGVGWFVFQLEREGFVSSGVEYDREKVEFSKMLAGWYKHPVEFETASVDLDYAQSMPEYDVITALSVLHWCLYDSPSGSGQYSVGMGMDKFIQFFRLLCEKARQAMVFEIPVHAMRKLGASNAKELGVFAVRHGGFRRAQVIGTSIDAKRPLIGCTK